MDLFSLFATLGLDSTSFLTGIKSAQDLFSTFASAVVGFSKDVMNTGLGFDQAMANVQAVLGQEQGTVENMNRLRSFALDQARSSIFTAEETAQAYYYMGMAGWKSEQMMAGLPGIMALAAASGENLGMVSDIVTDSLTAFGLTADDTSRYVDILAQAATNSNTNVYMMGETFKYAAPLAGALGFSVEDVAVAIGTMANQGVKASQAGTTLRRLFAGLTSEVKVHSDRLGDTIINTQNADGSMRELSEIVTDLRQAFAGLTEAEKSDNAEKIAGKYALSGFLALMNEEEDSYQNLTYAVNNAKGAAQAMADTRIGTNLAGDLTKLSSAFDTMKVAIYEDVKGPLREVVQWGTDAINQITDAINENGLAGGIDVLGQKIEEAGDKFAPLLESIGKAAGPLVSSIFDNVLPRLAEAGAKLGEGLLTALGNSMAENSSGVGGIAGLFLSTLGSGVKIIETISGWLKNAGELGGKSSAEAWQEGMIGIPQYEIDEISAKAAEWGKAWGTSAGDTMGANMGTEIGADAPAMRDDLAATLGDAGTGGGTLMADNVHAMLSEEEIAMYDELVTKLGAAGDTAGERIANYINNHVGGRTYTINVQANVSGLPTQQNASAMTAGRIFTRATVFGFANGKYQVAGDAGPEAVIGTGSLSQLIDNAVRGAMGGQTFTTPISGGAPRNIVIPVYIDGRELARVEVPYIEAEYQRIGTRLVTGGVL